MLIASIKTKMHAISPDVAEGLLKAVELAEEDYKGLVIWSPDELFSAGADLQAMLPAFMVGGHRRDRGAEARSCSRLMLRMRYAQRAGGRRPCAAWRWAAAASWRCIRARRVAAMESYIGLVEVGVGLVPGARRPDLHRAPRGRERGGARPTPTCCPS